MVACCSFVTNKRHPKQTEFNLSSFIVDAKNLKILGYDPKRQHFLDISNTNQVFIKSKTPQTK